MQKIQYKKKPHLIEDKVVILLHVMLCGHGQSFKNAAFCQLPQPTADRYLFSKVELN